MVNPLPNDKFLDWSKLKAFADEKMNVTQKTNFYLESVENIVGKGENAGYQHFLFLCPPYRKMGGGGILFYLCLSARLSVCPSVCLSAQT